MSAAVSQEDINRIEQLIKELSEQNRKEYAMKRKQDELSFQSYLDSVLKEVREYDKLDTHA